MGLIQFPTAIPATVGVIPALKMMITTDNLTTLTTAGYLNSANIDSAAPLSNGDVIMCLYSYNVNTKTGTFGIFTVSIAASNSSITLTNWANPGDVLLPVVPGDFAIFNGATGQIKDAGYFPSNPAKTIVAMSNGTVTSGGVASFGDTNGTLADAGFFATNVMQKNITNTFTSSGRLIANKVNGTEAANAVTASGMAGVITTSSLTTAGAGTYAITWTNTFITATSSLAFAIVGGTNTTQNITFTCVPGSGTATLTIYNNTAATALNGTIFISYLVI